MPDKTDKAPEAPTNNDPAPTVAPPPINAAEIDVPSEPLGAAKKVISTALGKAGYTVTDVTEDTGHVILGLTNGKARMSLTLNETP